MHGPAEETANTEKSVRYRSDIAPAQTLPEGFGTMVRFLAYFRPRHGECAALRVADVEHRQAPRDGRQSVTQVRGQGLVQSDTKTHQCRAVPILATGLIEELRGPSRAATRLSICFRPRLWTLSDGVA